jgi:hypothetical protein
MRGGLLSNPLEVGFTRDTSLIFPGFKYRMRGRRSRHFGINQQSRNLGGPRLSSMKFRFCGEPVTRLRRTTRWQDARVVGLTRHRTSVRHGVGYRKGNWRGSRWRQGVGGLHTSDDVGEQGRPWTRPSKGGPCRCDLVKGPMVSALTLGAMSAELHEVVGGTLP